MNARRITTGSAFASSSACSSSNPVRMPQIASTYGSSSSVRQNLLATRAKSGKFSVGGQTKQT